MECKVNCSWCWRLTIILTGALVIGWLQPIEATNLGGPTATISKFLPWIPS